MKEYFAGWLIGLPALLGEGRYVDMGRRFRRGGSTINPTDLMTVVAVVAIVGGLAWLIVRYFKLRERRNANNPMVLFRELCWAHRLDWASRQLLLALAKANGLTDPGRVFVEPQRFDTANLTPQLASRADRIAALHKQLFSQGGASADVRA